jgi:hypothetical protein
MGTEKHVLAYEEPKAVIARNVKLAYPKEEMIQCKLADASEKYLSGVVTQIPTEDANKTFQLHRHEPLRFVGHRCNEIELNWNVTEKECFEIKDTMQKLDYLLQMKRPFKLYCYHKHLIQIFSPYNVSKPSVQKLQRWALEMQRFRHEIQHIKGEDNLWADLLTWWGACPISEGQTKR